MEFVVWGSCTAVLGREIKPTRFIWVFLEEVIRLCIALLLPCTRGS